MMKIIIKPDTSIGNIQKEFNRRYPYLRLEFFKNSDKISHEEAKLEPSIPLGDLWNSLDHQVIDINEQRTISELEKDFRHKKLFLRVLRMSGRSWVATSLTKNWTLAQQNNEGEMLSSIHEATRRNEIDWNEWQN